jgi:hypothetical protein
VLVVLAEQEILPQEQMEHKVEILYSMTKLQLVEVMEQLVMTVVQQVVRVDQAVVEEMMVQVQMVDLELQDKEMREDQ